MDSTRPSAGAGRWRVSSGTSVPTPCTSLTISPRLTESMTVVERSTAGAAGLSSVNPYVIPASAATPRTNKTAVRIRFLIFDLGGRFISIYVLLINTADAFYVQRRKRIFGELQNQLRAEIR